MEKNKKKEFVARPMSITLKTVTLDKEGNVLLLRRIKKDPFNGGRWDLPGGHIHKGETINEAIKRELLEETGLEIEMGDVIKVTEFEKDSELFKEEKRGLRFIVLAEEGEVKINKKEHDKFVWLPMDEAIEKLSPKDGFEKEKRETLQIAKKRLEMTEAVENWKRTVADFENFKKRTAVDNESFRKFCLEGFVSEILPVLDNFEMATAHVPDDQKDEAWTSGIMHIKKQLEDVLAAQGVTEVEVKEGDEIDTEIHEVIKVSDTPVKSGKSASAQQKFHGVKKGDSTKIAKVLKKGFEMNGKIIRPASVEA